MLSAEQGASWQDCRNIAIALPVIPADSALCISNLLLLRTRAMDVIGAVDIQVPHRKRGQRAMRFEITSDDHILSMTDDVQTEAHEHGSAFATEQELKGLAGEWPMKRLIAIWNSLPGAQPVEKFENRQIALGRIWRAIQPQAESNEMTMRPSHPRTGHGSRVVFREGSKAAQVCSLLSRPEGATLNEIRSATGWQAHTVRGFISRTLRKQGRKVRSFEKNGDRIYRLRA